MNHHKYPAPNPQNKELLNITSKTLKIKFMQKHMCVHGLLKNIFTCISFMDA